MTASVKGGKTRGVASGQEFGSATFFGNLGGSGPGGSRTDAGPDPTRALDTYLEGLSRLDVQRVSSSSDSGPFALAGIVLDVSSIDAARGATTSIVLGQSSFTATSSSGSVVTFGGSVSLTTTISGPKGNGTFTDDIAGPVTVTREAGTWRVTGFTYDGLPVEVWPEDATETVNGLNVSLGYVVSYGNLTAALITLRQVSGSASVQLQSVTLGAGAATENGVGDFTGPPTPTGVLRFTRISSAPTSLTLVFSASAGQVDTFSFALS